MLFREFTGPWAFVHFIALLFLFSEFRYSLRRVLMAALCVIGPMTVAILYVYWRFGSEVGGQVYPLVYLLPMICFYLVVSKYRDGRCLFTLFMVNSLFLESIMLTNLLDFYLSDESHIVMFATRLVLYPLMEWLTIRRLREPHLAVQKHLASGWNPLALLAMLYNLLLLAAFNYPATLSARPDDIPAFLLIAAIGPLGGWQIIYSIFSQLELAASRERESLLQMQATSLQMRIEQTESVEKELAIYRHDQRHWLQTLYAMLEKDQIEAAKNYVRSSDRSLSETVPVHYCENPVFDAMFASYFSIAKSHRITVEHELDVPRKLVESESELSAVFANALENAINATKNLPRDRRIIRVRCVHYPQMMFRVANPFDGELVLDADGLPTTPRIGHGIGVRSIAAYCKKHGANYHYRTDDGWLVLTIIQMRQEPDALL